MFFTDLYKSPKATLSKFRQIPIDAADYGDPDLLSKDKVKQKAAVRKFLSEKVRNDWDFSWPPPPDAGAAAASPPEPQPQPPTENSNSTSTSNPSASTSTSTFDPSPAEPPPPPPPPPLIATSVTTTTTGPESTSQADGNQQRDAEAPAAVIVGVGVGEPDSTQSHRANGTTGLAVPAPHSKGPSTQSDLPSSDRATHPACVAGLAPAPALVETKDTTATTAPTRRRGYDNTIDDASDDDAESVYSVFSEDEANFRPRLEWASEISDDDSDDDPPSSGPFRFESPDTVGDTIRAKALSKKEKRRRALRDEASWNNGLACFEARRNAWTGAKVVQLRKKPRSPTSAFSPLSPRRLFFRSTPPPTPPLSTSPTGNRNGDSCALSDTSDSHKDAAACALTKKRTKSSASGPAAASYPIETIIPLPRPLLPPSNPLRASISPSTYPTLYDRLVRDGLTPGCPINLSDMIRACVCGWKRDGEWPPKASIDPPAIARRKKKKRTSESGARRMSFGLLGREKDGGSGGGGGGGGGDQGVLRKSVQRIFGLHHGPNGA